jgi:hypothetical protein
VKFLPLEELEELIHKWDDRKDAIIKAFKSGGMSEVAGFTKLSRGGARRVLVRLGVMNRRPSDKTPEEMLADQKKNNLEKLAGWGFTPDMDTLVLTKFYPRVAKYGFKCGQTGYYIKGGSSYKQYPIPRGKVRRYMEENGLKYFKIGDLSIPVEKVSRCHVLSSQD